MLKPSVRVGHGVFCRYEFPHTRLLNAEIYKAHISTNSAIQRTLRRSQNGRIKGRESLLRHQRGGDGGNTSDVPYSYERSQRPHHQAGLALEDMDQYRRINERHRNLRENRGGRRLKISNLKTLAKTSVSEGLSTSEVIRRSQYDYSPKPGGNRAIRRATKFGHPSESPSNARATVSGRRIKYHTVTDKDEESQHQQSALLNSLEGSATLSIPKVLQRDNEAAVQSSNRSFTMGRTPAADKLSRKLANDGSFRRGSDLGPNRATSDHESQIPISLPYTTPASEFLYGTSAVFAALESPRRKLYKLYIYSGDNVEGRPQDRQIRELALRRNLVVERVKGDRLRLMDKMSHGRPHNVRPSQRQFDYKHL